METSNFDEGKIKVFTSKLSDMVKKRIFDDSINSAGSVMKKSGGKPLFSTGKLKDSFKIKSEITDNKLSLLTTVAYDNSVIEKLEFQYGKIFDYTEAENKFISDSIYNIINNINE